MNALRAKVTDLLKDDKILRRVLRNTGYMFSSQSITLVLVFVQSLFSTRLLGPELFGLIAIITTVVTNINQLFSFRMGEFIIRFLGKELNEHNIDKPGAVVKAAALTEGLTSLVAYGALYLLAPLGVRIFAPNYLGDPNIIVGYIHLYGLAILAQITTETANGILQITNHYRTQATINFIQSAVTTVLVFIAFLLKADFVFVLWAFLIGKFITGLAPILMASIYLNQHLKTGWWRAPLSLLPSFKEMMRFAVSTNLSGTIKMLATGSEALWVAVFLDAKAVGLYTLAISLIGIFMMPVSALISTTFPELTRSVVSKKWSQLKQLLKRVSLISLIWSVAGFLVILILGRWAIELAYTKEFLGAYYTLLILIVGYGLSNIAFWNRSLLLAFGKPNTPLFVLAGAMLLKVALSFPIIPAFGINGAAALLAGNLILSVGVITAIGLLLVKRSEKLEPEETSE